MRNYPFKTIVACLSILWHSPQLWAADAFTPDTAVLDTIEVRGKRLTKDQKGEAQQYSKNVSTAYLSKEYLERYRPDAAGDILKGLNGVYNMNTRNAGSAITPSIRGIAGKGRIPVTIDGTEQTVDVWMNNYGVADRNYVDPALFRSIAVEKGPSMTRGVKSGVGGSVAIQTIEPEDIVPEGKKWGIQIKGSFSGNTAKPRVDNLQYLGVEDYRTIPGRPTADGAAGAVAGTLEPYQALDFQEKNPPRSRSNKIGNFRDDRSGMVSAAFKTDISDGLIAYSDRKKGNYFSGKRGVGGYLNNPEYDPDNADFGNTGATMIPNMAKLYRPGEEVFNSNVASKNLLLKNNWYLPNNQKISLGHMRTRVRFGENNPFYNAILLGFSNEFNFTGRPPLVIPAQTLNSTIDTKSHKIGYEWKPEGSRWIDLQANIWRTQTTGSRHQSGGPDLAVTYGDQEYDKWANCFVHNKIPNEFIGRHISEGIGCRELVAEGLVPAEEPKNPPPAPGAYRVKSGVEQRTRATRTSADISNRMRLTDRLAMTLSANVQYEKLDESNRITNNDKDIFDIIGSATAATAVAGPRAGRRHEWGAGVTFDWQATDRLNIQAGIRYDKFWAYDDALAKARRARKDPFYSVDLQGGKSSDGYILGSYIPYYELIANKEEADDVRKILKTEDVDESNRLINEFRHKYGYDYNDKGYSINGERQTGEVIYANANGDNPQVGNPSFNHDEAVYRQKEVYTPYIDGKHQGLVFAQGQFNEKVNNPQGLQGSYFKYLTNAAIDDVQTPYLQKKERATTMGSTGGHRLYKKPANEDEVWPMPKHLKAGAWSPVIAVSYDLTDNSHLFARFAQATRFPSIYEATTTNVNLLEAYNTEFNLEPERSTNWEAGYSFNFAPYWKRLKHGNIRLTYYNNTIKNAIDITENKNLTQYDKKQTSGIELQSRIDSSKWFASFGANYRLKQRTCDKSTAFNYDVYNNRIPECIDGGFGATRFYQTMQPKYSLNLDVGTRRFNNRLELGMRGIYHSTVDTDQQDELARQGLARIMQASGRPNHWRSALVWDAYGRYNFSKNLSMNFSVSNLTNRYYLDPMSNVPIPAPGRAVTVGFTGKF